jgi:polyhydroxyalkanoate synthase
LREPGGITLKDVPIDLSLVNLPIYMLAAREDHITPWKSTYRGLQTMKGTKRFVLAASGHIAGVVNSPESGKYSHWVANSVPPEPDEWEAAAAEMAGSWWPDWQRWVSRLAPETVPARIPGETIPAIEDAPGTYVTVMV